MLPAIESAGFLPRFFETLTRERGQRFAYSLALLLALIAIGARYPLSFFLGQGNYFEEGDAYQHVSGWLFYARDAWHFPLLHTERLNFPDGVNIAFTDSIPLAALPFKLIAGLLPQHFQYIGPWHALVYLGSALGMTFLMRVLGVRHLAGQLAAVFFVLCWPALLWRLDHTSLMTHGVLLLSLGLYFCARKEGGRSASLWPLAASGLTAVLALLIHPYLFAMCYSVFLALLIDRNVSVSTSSRRAWIVSGVSLLASIAAILVTGAVLGYFGGNTTAGGFGALSMNLNSPFCGGSLFTCPTAQMYPWRPLPISDATGGQYEGYNYFGLGLLLLMPFAVARSWSGWLAALRRYPALFALMAGFTVYALSNKVYFGHTELLAYALPDFLAKLTGTFRVSGRFFWSVGYLVLAATLVSLLRAPTRATLALVALAIPLQWLDTRGLDAYVRERAARPGSNDLAPWGPALVGIDRIHVAPMFGCLQEEPKTYWFFQRLAASAGKTINTGYVARSTADCGKPTPAFEDRTLYVMPAALLKVPATIPASYSAALGRGECFRWQGEIVCRPGWRQADWARAGLQVTELATEEIK